MAIKENPSGSAPIAIFGFNRPDKIKCLLQSLWQCGEFERSTVYFFIDGPSNTTDVALTEQVERIVRELAPTNSTILRRKENAGLRRSISEGVNFVLDRHEMIIVLEDDLVVSPQLIDYFNRALIAYAANSRVWSISAYMYDVPGLANDKSCVFLPFPNPWGWATWRSAWSKFSMYEQEVESSLNSKSFKASFDAFGLRNFTDMLMLDRNDLISSWFIRWYYCMFSEGGVTLYPPKSLVSNFGQAQGTHAGALNLHRFLPKSEIDPDFQPQLPEVISLDFGALDKIISSTDARIQKFISFGGFLRRRLRSFLQGIFK